MRRILATCLLLAIALPCQAQPKPNTLTPKEIADGWILLFDGETAIGWKAGSSELGVKPNLTAKDGQLVLYGIQTYAVATTRFQYYELSFEYRNEGSDDASFIVTTRGDAKKRGLIMGYGIQRAQGIEWARFRLHVTPGEVVQRLERPKMEPFENKGPLGKSYGIPEFRFSTDHKKDSGLFIRNFKLRPLATTPIFNGKDLAGWKEFPGKKSKFAVEGGAINVKDGPGDLQTVGKYKDFVLQLDAISHGKHLNSGIFFRCRDGEYQNGYEAQIFNKFSKDATQKYKIEEYDPKSNKLIATKESLFTAFDYGTGAIYRRMPARKEMSKDGEWFGMTIVAHGNHLATWVNGVQVADWTDNRPKSDNARTGCKLDAGHISIQGHDPTTSLSFKNFRIAELK